MKSKKKNAPIKIKKQMYEINIKYFFIIKKFNASCVLLNGMDNFSIRPKTVLCSHARVTPRRVVPGLRSSQFGRPIPGLVYGGGPGGTI